MNRRKVSLLTLGLLMAVLSTVTHAATDKCSKYNKSMAKYELQANELMERGKAKSALSKAKAYARTLKTYTKAACSDVDGQQAKLSQLEMKINKEINKGKCAVHEEKLAMFDQEAFNHLIASGDARGAERLLKNKYVKYVDKLKKTSCDNIEPYEEKLSTMIASLQGDACNTALDKMAALEQTITELAATVPETSGEARLRTGDIDSKVLSYTYALDSYKELQCSNDYAQFEQKIAQWKVAANPYAAYEKALQNNDLAAVEAAISGGFDINESSTPLKLAITSNRPDVVKLLANKGVDLNRLDKGTHPLDFEMSIYDKHGNTDMDRVKSSLEMKKLLISLGADFNQSSRRAVSIAATVGDLAFIKQLEASPLIAADYIACYWGGNLSDDATVLPVDARVKSYCADKIQSSNLGKEWSDVAESMSNRSLEKEILSLGNRALAASSGVEMEELKITSKEWHVTRNALGVILHRDLYAAGYVKNSDGVCYTKNMQAHQDHQGERYGQTSVNLLGVTPIDCD